MKLSIRLQSIADMVTPCDCLADIGTDHALLPIYLIQNNIINKAIASDINNGPLLKAKSNIYDNKVENKIELRLSDGLDNIKADEADCRVIAGMGGELIIRILEHGRNNIPFDSELVFCPHSHSYDLRKYLRLNGYETIDETMVYEDTKYYFVIKCIFHGDKYKDTFTREFEDFFGRILIERKDQILLDYLKKEKDKFTRILENIANPDKDHEVVRYIQDINLALDSMMSD